MIVLSPRRIDAIKSGFSYLSQKSEAIVYLAGEIIVKPTIEIAHYIPKTYRYPGYILYQIYDKESVMKSTFYSGMAEHMNNDDVLGVVNKKPTCGIIFPQWVLPQRYKDAIAIQKICKNHSDLIKYFPECQPCSEAVSHVYGILNGDFPDDAKRLLKILIDEKNAKKKK